MKIKIADIEPNPYRKIDEYPIDEEKVTALMNSITEKTFWDNILVRPHPTKKGKYQLAYGHHRLVALQRLKFKEIDIPCRNIEDAAMIQIMAEENLNWSTAPTVMVQTIQAAKDFIDDELAKYEKFEDMTEEIFSHLFENPKAFTNAKREDKGGVGRETIVKFLGGNWTDYRVQTALSIIKDKTLDEEAIKTIPTMEQANVFRLAVKEHDIPKKTQQKIAKVIKDDGIGKRDIPDLVAEHSLKPAIKPEPKPLPTIDKYTQETTKMMFDLMKRLDHLVDHIDNVLSVSVHNEFCLHVTDLIERLKYTNKELKNVQEEKKKTVTGK